MLCLQTSTSTLCAWQRRLCAIGQCFISFPIYCNDITSVLQDAQPSRFTSNIMSRRVRRAPLSERLSNYFDPRDWLLWLSEEVQTSDWAQVQGKPTWLIGLGANLLFMLALSKSQSTVSANDDVFGDYATRSGSGWLRAISWLLTYVMGGMSVLNTFWVFNSTKKYRFFERSLEEMPQTPNAKRVRVDDSPLAIGASPAKYLVEKLRFGVSAEARAHPDPTRDVVELSIWTPPALCLRLFTLFSPAHLIVYWSFLPTSPLDSRPSVTILRTLLLAALITAQSYAFESFFTQQVQDKLILSKEVLHEYDTKYVHPSINRPARDVAIQTPPRKERGHREMGTDPIPQTPEVEVSREYTIINRGFRTNPNPAYASHFDRDNHLGLQDSVRSRGAATPAFHTPSAYTNGYTGYTSTGTGTAYGQDMSSPVRAPESMQPPSGFASMPASRPGVRKGDGGSFGIHTSAHSPLKKAASHSSMRLEGPAEQLRRREGSPLKRVSLPAAPDVGVGGASGLLDRRLKDMRGEGSGRRQSGRF